MFAASSTSHFEILSNARKKDYRYLQDRRMTRGQALTFITVKLVTLVGALCTDQFMLHFWEQHCDAKSREWGRNHVRYNKPVCIFHKDWKRM